MTFTTEAQFEAALIAELAKGDVATGLDLSHFHHRPRPLGAEKVDNDIVISRAAG